MKKIIMAGLSCVLAASLVGCQNEEQPKQDQPQEQKEDVLQYEVISEGYAFDMTPTTDPFYNEGYIVKENGLFGLMSASGDYIMEPQYSNVEISREESMIQEKNYLFMRNPNTNSMEKASYYLGYSQEKDLIGGIGGISAVYTIDAQDELTVIAPWEASGYAIGWDTLDRSRFIPKVDVSPTKMEEFMTLSFDEYYIVMKDGKRFGPYSAKQTPFFRSDEWDENFLTMEIDHPDCPFIHGMFYEIVDGKYKIYNEAGTQAYPELVDEATPLSWNAMKIVKDGKMGVINSDLELVLYGDFEAVTLPINGHAFVQVGGDWKLVELK